MTSKRESAEKRLTEALNYLKVQGLTSEEIVNLVNHVFKPKDEVKVPIHIFRNGHLSSLETIVKYLRENLLLSFRQIGSLTARNPVALAVTYRNAKKKMGEALAEGSSPYHIPVSILQNRSLSVLENIVSYLKDTFGLAYHAIAALLNRDDRTIWTVYSRCKKKRQTA